MVKGQPKSLSLIPLNSPRLKEFKNLDGSCAEWLKRAEKFDNEGSGDAALFCRRKAYFDSDNLSESFYKYCQDIVMEGFGSSSQLDPEQHMKMCRFITGKHNRKLLLASRGSFKSTIGALGYATWRVAREVVLTGESRLRILFASENLSTAKRNMMFVKNLMEWSKSFIELAGEHKGEKADRQTWGVYSITSQFRSDPAIGEPTFSPIGIQAGRVGFHFDIVICDDLQAWTMSTTPEQIDNVDEFFKLLFSMLVQDGTAEFLILGTRWHNDDIYQRIKDRNDRMDKRQLSARKFKVLEMPARDKRNGSITFTTIYTESLLQEIRETQGARIYANQYMLEAVDEEEIKLKHEYLQYWTPKMIKGRRLNLYVTCDFAFTKVDSTYRGNRSKRLDYTVILTVGIDDDWNYFVLDWFRERCSKRSAIREFYRQFFSALPGLSVETKPISVLMQKFDRAQIKETIDQYAYEVNKYVYIEWISYPSTASKYARIESSVVPLFEAGHIFIPPNMQWFVNAEYDKFGSRQGHDDALDALCNVAYYSNPVVKQKDRPRLNKNQIRISRLKAGRGCDGEQGASWKMI